MADIKRRKKKLEDDLELLEDNFEHRISSVQSKVMGTLKPVEYIKKNPLKAVGTSILIGAALGLMGKEKTSSGDISSHGSHKEKLFDLLFDEVKRVAARKAATFLSDLIDEKMSKSE